MNQKPKYKRSLKNFLINPAYQLRYIFWLSSSGLLLVSINGYIAYSFIKENYTTLVDLSPMSDEAKAQLYRELNQLVLSLGGISAIFLAIVVCVGIIYSHRTAGPMYHFKRVFDSVHQGDLKQRIMLRPKDEFQDVAHSFNTMLDTIVQDRNSPEK